MREPSQLRSRQARALKGGNLAESPMRFPIIPRRSDLLGSPRDEVPPHQDRFSEWQAAKEQTSVDAKLRTAPCVPR